MFSVLLFCWFDMCFCVLQQVRHTVSDRVSEISCGAGEELRHLVALRQPHQHSQHVQGLPRLGFVACSTWSDACSIISKGTTHFLNMEQHSRLVVRLWVKSSNTLFGDGYHLTVVHLEDVKGFLGCSPRYRFGGFEPWPSHEFAGVPQREHQRRRRAAVRSLGVFKARYLEDLALGQKQTGTVLVITALLSPTAMC